MPPEKKQKLRTASDVISRLRWSYDEDDAQNCSNGPVIMGYMDRIIGPMEKPVDNFVAASNGGDIPEHRILYFRLASGEILWDRAGRVDRIFGSGNGPDAKVSLETLDAVQQAAINMENIEKEREERRKRKAKERAQRARRSELSKMKLNLAMNEASENRSQSRFHWHKTPYYRFSQCDESWIEGSTENERTANVDAARDNRDLVVVTWNVLFDLYDGGVEGDDLAEECDRHDESNPSLHRWSQLCSILEETKADLLSLQEVTPSFAELLLNCDWVQKDYASSASPFELQSVSPCGVLLLWRRSTFRPLSQELALYQCSDLGRCRSMSACLLSRQDGVDSVVIFCAAHLPADKAAGQGASSSAPASSSSAASLQQSRQLARKRELSSILGQVQRIEARVQARYSEHVALTPVIAGDFNCEDEELRDGSFAGINGSEGFYLDAWTLAGDGPGLTFDPALNQRAARSSRLVGGQGRAKRIDRIFVGASQSSDVEPLTIAQLVATEAKMIGTDIEPIPPSDHFGVRVVLQLSSQCPDAPPSSRTVYSPWAANAPPSRHDLLAIVLDNPKLESLKAEHDAQSSFPPLHLTLLHGFVEANMGCLDLIKSTVQNALDSIEGTPPEILALSEMSLNVFEHRASASLVARPDRNSRNGIWLTRLYRALREQFRLCDEQEAHSEEGWNPHVTLGVYGSATAARSMQQSWISDGTWDSGEDHLSIHSIDVLRRGPSGRFQTIACLPIVPAKRSCEMRDFLSDAGASCSKLADRQNAIVIAKLQRACRSASNALGCPATPSVHIVGSASLGVALPGISDLDVVVKLQPPDSCIGSLANATMTNKNEFLHLVAAAIKADVPCAKVRLRKGGETVMLTIRIAGLPSVDATLCQHHADGTPMDAKSEIALGVLRVSAHLRDTVSPLLEAYQGALRIIKLWAHRRDVYGAMTGFLGGGSWAVWLARVLSDNRTMLEKADGSMHAAHQLVRLFFQKAACWPWSQPIQLRNVPPSLQDDDMERHPAGTLLVLAPCSPGNLARTTTQSTTSATLQELHRAASMLQQQAGCANLSSILASRTTAEWMDSFPCLLVMEVGYLKTSKDDHDDHSSDNESGDGYLKPAELKAWGSQRFLHLLTRLERQLGDVSNLRPKSRPLHLGREWPNSNNDDADNNNKLGFAWTVGVTGSEHRDELQSFIQQAEANLRIDAESAAFGKTPLQCAVYLVPSSSHTLHH